LILLAGFARLFLGFDLDLETGRLFVRRKKGSLSTHQPIEGDELRAIRAWLREREQRRDAHSPYLFLSERGPMTRQAVKPSRLVGSDSSIPRTPARSLRRVETWTRSRRA